VIVLTPEEKASFKKEIADIKKDIEENRIAGVNIQKSDFAAGRTMRDHLGVLCRTEQAVYRPTTDTIRIINMTARGTPTPENLNYVQDTMKFNGALSSDIVQAAKDINLNRVKLIKTEFEASNSAPSVDKSKRDIFTATYDVVADQGSMTYNEQTFDIIDGSQQEITKFSDSSFTSVTKFGTKLGGTANGDLVASNWILNNAGKILGKDDFVADPGQLLNKMRNDVTFELQLDFTNTFNRNGGKINVIVIPDIMFQMFDLALKEAGNMGVNINFSGSNDHSGNN
jgi:hypothetical protein